MWRASYNLFCDNGASAASSLSAKCSHTLQYASLYRTATRYHICNPSDNKIAVGKEVVQ